MDAYSIEIKSQSIVDSKTKDYFSEVYSSYVNGNLRSSVVMLWSVAVCDILFKLNYLVDMYSDPIAISILKEITELQENNPKSPEWETKLLELILRKTKLLEIADYDNLIALQKQRHLCAHPVLSKSLELHNPNKDTVRALIRNTIDGLLSKPAIYTQKIFDHFIEDLSSSASILIDDDKLEKYLFNKYLSKMTKDVELSILRSLWKLTFRLVNPDCDKNRSINWRALKYLIKRNANIIPQIVSKDSDYYSNIANSGDPPLALVVLLSQNPGIYHSLNESAKTVIKHIITTNNLAFIYGWFISDSFDVHFSFAEDFLNQNNLIIDLSENTFKNVLKFSDSREYESLVLRFANYYYGSSYNFNLADLRYSKAIRPLLDLYGEEELIDLLKKIENNPQTYRRGAAREDHSEIRKRCDIVLGSNFDYNDYPMFLHYLS